MNAIRRLPDHRRQCLFEHTPSWRLALYAIASLWWSFFLLQLLLRVSPSIAQGVMNSEPISLAGLSVICISTVAAYYLRLFGGVLKRTTLQLDRRLFQ